MNWSDVGDWLQKNAGSGAALVGSLLMGNVPGAVAAGVSLVSSATGHATPQEALSAFQGDPATVVKLKELANQEADSIRKHIEAMARQDIDRYQAEAADRQGARGRDVELAKAGKNNQRGDVLAYMAMGGLLAVGLALFFLKVPEDSHDFLVYLLGALTVIVKDVYGFEFGSSKSGEKNAQAVAEIAKAP